MFKVEIELIRDLSKGLKIRKSKVVLRDVFLENLLEAVRKVAIFAGVIFCFISLESNLDGFEEGFVE